MLSNAEVKLFTCPEHPAEENVITFTIQIGVRLHGCFYPPYIKKTKTTSIKRPTVLFSDTRPENRVVPFFFFFTFFHLKLYIFVNIFCE